MHTVSTEQWEKNHQFTADSAKSELRTILVIGLTFITMIFEITSGYLWGSMALLADGWHMGTHVSALLITYAAYYYARTRKNDVRFSYGTGKIGVLGGYTSAIVLAIVSFYIAYESFERIISPAEIHFNESMTVAFVGLAVNLLSAALLGFGEHHGHSHSHGQPHKHEHSKSSDAAKPLTALHNHSHDESAQYQDHHTDTTDILHNERVSVKRKSDFTDHNLRAAYFHVLADALTSVLAIGALLAGKYMNWVLLDPLTGLFGAVIIIRWALILLKDTVPILVDGSADQYVLDQVKQKMESYKDVRVVDLHMWRVSSSHYSLQMSIVTAKPEMVENYYRLLDDYDFIDHLSVEVFQCKDPACVRAGKNHG